MKKQKYACKYGLTSNRKCLVPFSGNGTYTCRLYELGRCNFDKNGNPISNGVANNDVDTTIFEKTYELADDNKLKSEEKMIGTLDIEIYEKSGVGSALAKYLVHGFEDVFWTDYIDEALAFLKQDIINKERSPTTAST